MCARNHFEYANNQHQQHVDVSNAWRWLHRLHQTLIDSNTAPGCSRGYADLCCPSEAAGSSRLTRGSPCVYHALSRSGRWPLSNHERLPVTWLVGGWSRDTWYIIVLQWSKTKTWEVERMVMTLTKYNVHGPSHSQQSRLKPWNADSSGSW